MPRRSLDSYTQNIFRKAFLDGRLCKGFHDVFQMELSMKNRLLVGCMAILSAVLGYGQAAGPATSGASASPTGRSNQKTPGASASPTGRSNQKTPGASASPIGRSN